MSFRFLYRFGFFFLLFLFGFLGFDYMYSALSRDRNRLPGASQLVPKIAVTSGQASQPAQFLKVDKELGEPQHPLGTAAKSRSWFGCADVPRKPNQKKRKKIRGLKRGYCFLIVKAVGDFF